ncbi:hypothetical protein PR202_ga12909 [Eleusine coracana subsp. coracana]|uniref:Uncharacterized protein n=1 Tax=Eleusine coracana subsp. coracana TaxID=191504 RepID=A0AAV5CDF5_ELECO|nr:hypothetical protein PR202_ga12909 [Eleusine coracana subsp. coracana]
MAVENQSGGRDSRAKADELGASIVSWFCNSKGHQPVVIGIPSPGPHYFEDLVDMMYDTISESLNADFEDGSVEEVAADNDDGSDSSDGDDDDDVSMMDDEATPHQMAMDNPRPPRSAPDADGWTVVPPRHGRGRN